MKNNWKISEGATDWECDWASNERFHLRSFKALPMADKVKAVEEMCRLADLLKKSPRAHPTPPSAKR